MPLAKYIAPTACPKCKGIFELGFTADYYTGATKPWASVHERLRWFAGKPKPAAFGGFKVSDTESATVKTFRCAQCGYLESYA